MDLSLNDAQLLVLRWAADGADLDNPAQRDLQDEHRRPPNPKNFGREQPGMAAGRRHLSSSAPTSSTIVSWSMLSLAFVSLSSAEAPSTGMPKSSRSTSHDQKHILRSPTRPAASGFPRVSVPI